MCPGWSTASSRDGRLVHVGTLGRAGPRTRGGRSTPDSLFRIASMSKAFTALAILKLRDEGRLSLDALAETYVPELRGWRYPTSDRPRIRVRDLLSHVGGFVTDDPWGDRQQVAARGRVHRACCAPACPSPARRRAAFEYSNFGYALLGRIVTNVSGRPYQGLYRAGDHAPARHGLDRLRHLAPRRRSAARSAIAGRMTLGRASRTWRTARSARWAASRPAPTIMPAGSPSCSPPGRPRDGPEAGPVRRSTVRELAQGLELRRAVAPPPRRARRALPAGRGLWHGLARRAGLRPRPHPGAWRRLSGLRLLSAAAARPWRRHLRLRQPHLCRPVAAGLERGAGAAPRRPAAGRGRCRSATRSPRPIAPPARCTRRAISSRRAGLLAMNFLMDRSPRTGRASSPRLKRRGRRLPTPTRRSRRPARWPAASPGPATRGRLAGQAPARPDQPADDPGAALCRVAPAQ